jgi:hypothetical protein
VLWNSAKVKLFFSNQQVFEKFVGDFFLTAALWTLTAEAKGASAPYRDEGLSAKLCSQ